MRPRALVRLVQRLRRPGIIYCSTRRDVDEIYALLRRFGIPAHHYHGGMNAKERNEEQVRFMRPRTRTIMVATSAFGLGIDKPDIRYVMHYQAPAALEQYVQEAGRAGRDGRKSNCILLADVEPDRKVHEALLSRSRLRPEQLYRLGSALAAWSGEGRDPSLEALALSAELGPRIAAGLLATLEQAGLVERVDKDVHIVGKQETIEADTRSLAGRFETLRTQDGRRLDFIGDYTGSDECRAVFLRRYFGEDDDGDCGLCDLCRGRTQRPDSFFEPLVRPQKKRGKKRRPRRRSGARTAKAGEESDGNKKKKSGSRRSSRSRGRRGGRGRGRRGGGRESGGDAPKPAPTSSD
jgi:ATP-dependent DNA helicase RecQ